MATQIVLPHPLTPPPLFDYPFSLYAGDLHPDVTESDLHILFSTVGPLRTVHLCRDRLSRKSLCYAYINFFFPFHAADALSRLNHTELRGKPMRVMWCQRDPLVRKTGMGNLFVKNLDFSVHDARLEEVFRKFGTILSCKIAKDDSGKSKGFGFVQFDSEESARDAINALNDTVLDGKVISVAKFLRRSERKGPEFTNLYVKNLDEDFTETQLKDQFSEYGKVTSAVVMNDAEGKSREFGFVNFESHDDAKKAMESLNGALIGSKKWFVGKAMNKAERESLLRHKEKPDASNLFVRNLATSVDERSLEQVFGALGRVTLAKVVRNKNGVSKGFGYVCFSNPEEAKKATDSLNGFRYHGKCMNVSLAISKEECTKHLQTLSALRHMTNMNICNDQYLPPSYNVLPVAQFPVYDVNWQPGIYGNVDLLPTLKPQIFQQESSKGGVYLRNGKDQKLSMKAAAKWSTSAKENQQAPRGAVRSGVKWEMKRSKSQKAMSTEKSLKIQVEKAVQANIEASSQCMNY